MRILSPVFATRAIENASAIQRLMLTAGSGLVAIADPTRDDMINTFGELTGQYSIKKVYEQMRSDPEGSQILADKPIINSETVDLKHLATLPVNSFGREYVEFLERNKITPDSRKPVKFIEDYELAYVMTRYRQIHDFTHCILGLKTNMLGEVTVKVFEAIQLGMPMCWLGGMFGVLRLGPKHTQAYLDSYLPWILVNAQNSKPLINVYFEKHFNTPIDQLRQSLNLTTLVKNNSKQEEQKS